jgi:CheY-like chemotaxis protein
MTQPAKKILIVEDEPLIAMKEAEMIRKYGFTVIAVYTAAAALELFENDGDFDLVLMDIDLGDGPDGAEVARQILDKKEIPIEFLTAHREPDFVERARGSCLSGSWSWVWTVRSNWTGEEVPAFTSPLGPLNNLFRYATITRICFTKSKR